MSSGKTFLARFLDEQARKGNAADMGPLFDTLCRINDAEQNQPASAPGEEWKVTPEELDAHAAEEFVRGVKSLDTIARERSAARAQRQEATSRSQYEAAPLPKVAYTLDICANLTACLDSAPCPRTARKLFRLLHEIGLETIRRRGLPARPDIAVFHLPIELLAAYLDVDRTTVWRNVKPLRDAGLIDERDHYDTLRGQTAVTGKIWAIATAPELVLSGQNRKVRLTYADIRHQWRDLERDVKAGRTAYNLTRTEAQQQADRAKREAQATEQAEARARAEARKAEREAAKKRGEKVLTGRAAATVNAAETRAQRKKTSHPSKLQQSLEAPRDGTGAPTPAPDQAVREVSKNCLMTWALNPFLNRPDDVTLTVANGAAIRPLSGLDTVYSLSLLPGLTKQERNAAVEAAARSLAAAFGDSENLRFWCWLLWQLIRGCDQGQNWTDDVSHLLARVLHDIRHDESMNGSTVKNPAAVVVNELRNCGLLDALRALAPTRAGGRPRSPEPAPLFA